MLYRLQGFEDPPRALVSPSNPEFRRFTERQAKAGALAAAGTLATVRWTVFAELGNREDRHFSERRRDPPTDRWSAEGWRTGGALQVPLLDHRLVTTVTAEYAGIHGEGFRADLQDPIFRARERSFHALLHARYTPEGPDGRSVVGRVALTRDARRRSDVLAEVGEDLVGWTSAAGVEITWPVAPAALLAAGLGGAAYAAVSKVPDPEFMGPVYRFLLAPEMSLYAAGATGATASVALRRRIGDAFALVAQASGTSVGPPSNSSPLPFLPEGRRRSWGVSLAGVWEH